MALICRGQTAWILEWRLAGRRVAERPAERGRLPSTFPTGLTAGAPQARGCSPPALKPPASDRALQHLPSVAQEEAIWPRETDSDSVWSHLGISPPLKASPDQSFHLYLQGNATHLCSQERGTSERVVTWVSGCAGRRHSPGNGTLEPALAPPHLARVGGRGELNQAPSLGVARHLRDILVWRGPRQERLVPGVGLRSAGGFGQESQPSPGCFSRTSAGPRWQQEPSSPAVPHAASRCLWFPRKKRSFHLD